MASKQSERGTPQFPFCGARPQTSCDVASRKVDLYYRSIPVWNIFLPESVAYAGGRRASRTARDRRCDDGASVHFLGRRPDCA